MVKTTTRWLAAGLVACAAACLLPIAAHSDGGEPDEEPPFVTAVIDGKLLRVAAYDSQSGVKTVYVGGRRITKGIDGLMSFVYDDYADENGSIVVYAVDNAGNESEPLTIAKPARQGAPAPAATAKAWRWPSQGGDSAEGSEHVNVATPAPSAKTEPHQPSQQSNAMNGGQTPITHEGSELELEPSPGLEPESEPEAKSEIEPELEAKSEIEPELDAKSEIEPELDAKSEHEPKAVSETTEPAVPYNPQPFTPEGTGTAINHADSASKKFYVIQSDDENVFYLIIDHDRETNNVYFLNNVTEEDLLSLAGDASPRAATQSSIPDLGPERIDATEIQATVSEPAHGQMAGQEASSEPTQEPELEHELEPSPNNGGAGPVVFVVIAMIAIGGVGYYVKIVQPKKRKLQSDEDGEGEGEDDETSGADEIDIDSASEEDEGASIDARMDNKGYSYNIEPEDEEAEDDEVEVEAEDDKG